MKCDDNVPMVGGTMTLTRSIDAKAGKRGAKCPTTTTTRKCNQKKCEVDCVLGDWSGFSKCTKECEGPGLQTRNRNIVVRPKNGGQACDVGMESQSCGEGSCDADCELAQWT